MGNYPGFWEYNLNAKNSTIRLNQSRYIEKILSKFGMADCKPHSTPCEIDIKKISDKIDLIDSKPYHEIIGSVSVCIYIYIYIYSLIM